MQPNIQHSKNFVPQYGTAQDDGDDCGICGALITFFSYVLVIITLPVSVWGCVKVKQGDLEGGRNCFWLWKDMELLCDNFFLVALSIDTSYFSCIVHAEYFAQINLNLKIQFCDKASFSLLSIIVCPWKK